MSTLNKIAVLFVVILFLSCKTNHQDKLNTETMQKDSITQARTEIYAPVKLTTNVSNLTNNQKQVLKYLILAAQEMDKIFWKQANPDEITVNLQNIDENTLKFYQINYGPWDRLNNNMPFIKGVGKKPEGANFYPIDMSKQEFEEFNHPDKTSLYTLIRRNEQNKLVCIPYSEAYSNENSAAANYLSKAAELTENAELKNYLNLRAQALLTNTFEESDRAWLDLKTNIFDIIIGPIENYEDKLFGYKAANEAYVLIKDIEWSKRLEKYVAYLPELQENLPVDPKYKTEKPGSNAQLNAYDVVYYAGDCNSGSKTIAVNLPNDETLQKEKGTRRSQLKNAMLAKFDKILVPIAQTLIDTSQLKHITFEAFFGNTMFHEVAHGLGVKNTINNKGTAREALKERYAALEEGKADILGLFMVTYLYEKGVYNEGQLMDNYVTFLAGIFRSVRFGAASAHGKANMLRFNYFADANAFERNMQTGLYSVNFNNMKLAMNNLSALILQLQAEGDYEGVGKLMNEKGNISDLLKADLNKLTNKNIPVDVVFEQGIETLGL